MRAWAAAALALLALPMAGMAAPGLAGAPGMAETCRTPILIAHRGASADRPEHSLMAYRLAIAEGADFIEPDLVPTKDGVLVARHENEISGTTDVAARPEFAARKATKVIDGEAVTGWFTEDFTLAELKTLRVRERLPQLRPANRAFDGQEAIPTLGEILALVKEAEAATGRRIGIYPETKHPSYFRGIGLPLEDRLLKELADAGYVEASDPVFIQSFEVGNLEELRKRTRLRLIQLMAKDGGPVDRPALRYADMATPAGLSALARHVDGIGVEKAMVIGRTAADELGAPTSLVADAHAAGLAVHVWTFRPENYFLPKEMRSSDDMVSRGKAVAEIGRFLEAGIDGLFSDSVRDGADAIRTTCGQFED